MCAGEGQTTESAKMPVYKYIYLRVSWLHLIAS